MFEGVYTAIVTPFRDDDSIDEEAFRALLDRQIEGGVDGVVPVGTTGESPTLDFEEHHRVIELAVELCRGRIKVIAGTGGNSTREAIELTARARDAGADGTLQVTPYYNKPSQTGLIRHFSAVADLGLPTVLYNVPGRSVIEIEVDTVAQLAQHPDIVAIKEAGGDAKRVSRILRRCDIEVISGDDALTLPMMDRGAVGVISVASNLIPAEVSTLVHEALSKNWSVAQEQHAAFHALFDAMFIESNPVPVKTALGMMGLCDERVRSPLYELSPEQRTELESCLRAYRLL